MASALVAALIGGYPPLEPLAALVMEWTPVPIANALLDLLGPVGKPLALYGAAAIVLALAGPLALVAARGPFGALNRPLALGLLLAGIWALARPGALPGLVTLVLATLGAYAWLERRAARRRRRATSRATTERAPGRRAFLLRAAANTAALAAVSLLPVAASSVRTALVGRVPRSALFPFAPPPPRAEGFALPGLTP